MEPALRPMSLGEILDRTAELYRTNFGLFAGIFVVYAGAALAMNLLVLGLEELLRAEHMIRAAIWVRLSALGIEWLVLFLMAGAAVAAICRAVAWVHLGEPATIRGAYASILPRLGRYLWLMTVTFFVVWTPIVLLYLGYFGTVLFFGRGLRPNAGATAQHAAGINPQAAMVALTATAIFLLLMIPAVVYTILMALRYALALPACVVEDLAALRAIRRGIDLSKGSRGRIFVLGVLIFAIKLVFVAITQAFVFIAAFRHRGQIGPGLTVLSQVMTFFTNTFLGPIYATGITLLYYDQRVRQEGYDIVWMMEAAGLTPPALEAGPAAPIASGDAGDAQGREPDGPGDPH